MTTRIRSSRFRSSILLPFLAWFGATGLQAAEPPTLAAIAASHDAYLLRAGVVVDPARSMLYAMRPQGGLEAVDIDRGTVRWSTSDADVPLLVFGDLLFAWREPSATSPAPSLEIVALGLDDGARRFSASAALPAGVRNRIDDGLGVRFAVRAWRAGNTTRFGWTFHRQVIGGMAASTSAPEITSGILELRFADEQLRTVAGATMPPAPRPDVPAAERLPGLTRAQFVSRDATHVLASEQIADDRTFEKYRWTVVTADGNTALGSIRSHVSQASFGIVNGQILHESRAHERRVAGDMQRFPLAVRSVDLRQGQVRWTQLIRDTAYRGPFPP